MDAKISRNFWSDPAIEALDAHQKLAFLWLVSNERTNLLGYIEITPRRFEFETGCPYQALESLCEALPKGIIKCGKGYWLRTYIARQIGTGKSLVKNNFCRAICRHMRASQGLPVFEYVLKEYPELESVIHQQESKPIASPPQGLTKPERGEERRGDNYCIDDEHKAVQRATPPPMLGAPSDPIAAEAASLAATTGFAEFWAAYPKRRGEMSALRAWVATADVRPPLPELLTALAAAAASDEWRKEAGRFVPMAATWLTDHRWTDAVEAVAVAGAKVATVRKLPAPADWQAAYDLAMGESAPEGVPWERLPDHVQRDVCEAAKNAQEAAK